MTFWAWLWDMITQDFGAGEQLPDGYAPPMEEPPVTVEIGARPAGASGGMLASFTDGEGSKTSSEMLRPINRFTGTAGDTRIVVKIEDPHYRIEWYEGNDSPKGVGDYFEQGEEISKDRGRAFLSGWGGVPGQLPTVELVERQLTLTKTKGQLRAATSGPDFGSATSAPSSGYHKQISINVIKGDPVDGAIRTSFGDTVEFTTAPTGIEARVKVRRGTEHEKGVTFPTGGWKFTENGPQLKYGGNMGRIIDKGNWQGSGTKTRVQVQPKSTYSAVLKLEPGKVINVAISPRIDIYVRKKTYKKWKFGGPVLKYILKLYSYFSQKGEEAGIFGKAWKKWKEYLYSK